MIGQSIININSGGRGRLSGIVAALALLGFILFVLIIGAAYGFSKVFSGRGAYLHVGAIIGTIMVGNVFRIIIMDFIDAHSFDVRSVKKSCVHIVSPDMRIIPFDTYNMFYRGDLEREVLLPIRRELEAAGLSLMPAQDDESTNVGVDLPLQE